LKKASQINVGTGTKGMSKICPFVSVIIPTFNRCQYLSTALESVQRQSYPPEKYEIIVVDNGSDDNTRQVVEASTQKGTKEIRYVYDDRHGLHIGRHKGAEIAQGDILLYTDDDVIAHEHWITEIACCYTNRKICAVGGKVVPKWEAEPPAWVEEFGHYLSLIDLGENYKRLYSANCIYGCNLSIRKDILFKMGGFNPDSVPSDLIKYRGDGETALMKKVLRGGYKLIYNPRAIVEHVIPRDRLTLNYLKRRAFLQGISRSFTDIRAAHGLDPSGEGNPLDILYYASRYLRACKRRVKRSMSWKTQLDDVPRHKEIRNEIIQSHMKGGLFHRKACTDDPLLFEYVLRDNYLGVNGEIPR